MTSNVMSAKEQSLLKKSIYLNKINIKTFSYTGATAPFFWVFGMTEAMEHVFGMMLFMFICGVGLALLSLILLVRRELWVKRMIANAGGRTHDEI
jgi:hypothetical protein